MSKKNSVGDKDIISSAVSCGLAETRVTSSNFFGPDTELPFRISAIRFVISDKGLGVHRSDVGLTSLVLQAPGYMKKRYRMVENYTLLPTKKFDKFLSVAYVINPILLILVHI